MGCVGQGEQFAAEEAAIQLVFLGQALVVNMEHLVCNSMFCALEFVVVEGIMARRTQVCASLQKPIQKLCIAPLTNFGIVKRVSLTYDVVATHRNRACQRKEARQGALEGLPHSSIDLAKKVSTIPSMMHVVTLMGSEPLLWLLTESSNAVRRCWALSTSSGSKSMGSSKQAAMLLVDRTPSTASEWAILLQQVSVGAKVGLYIVLESVLLPLKWPREKARRHPTILSLSNTLKTPCLSSVSIV